VADSGDTVLSLTLSDGSNVQYVVKAAEPVVAHSTVRAEPSTKILQNWQLARLGTAVNVSDAMMPLGIALRISN
jgi:hypothetical protein